MSDEGMIKYHNDTRVWILALEERCKTLEVAVSILQRKVETMEQAKVIEYNLSLDRAQQK